MEAKDTVMKDPIKRSYRGILTKPEKRLERWDIEGLLEAQAEISFKIGKTAGVAESLIPSLKAIEASRKAGIKEVVEWIPELIQTIKDAMWEDDWGVKGVIYEGPLDALVKRKVKAKLKEWGIIDTKKEGK